MDRISKFKIGLAYAVISALLLILLQTTSLAVPVAPFNKEIAQPDGTKVRIIRFGDEWQNWYETADGYTVIKDNASGWWYYAEQDEKDDIKKSPHAVGKVNPEAVKIRKGVRPKAAKHHNQLK
ncbi:MAG: hypothetical protein HZC44_12060 [Geobacter sp.]|nr:hypothetical protein [Geobacter sp.]